MIVRKGFTLIEWLVAILIVTGLGSVVAVASSEWRSVLYPEDWVPPGPEAAFYTDKIIQDFSRAGYRNGEAPIPDVTGPVFDVTGHGADPTGNANSTAAIQAAIQAAAAAGGGVVYLPAGTYRVAPAGSASYALQINVGGIVLRGAGRDKTFILNTETNMRSRGIIRVEGPSSMERVLYGGGGGNGYLYRLQNSADNLVTRCLGNISRHGYVYSHWASTGNVIHRSTDRDTQRAIRGSPSGSGSDHHMQFSHSNLADSNVMDNSFFDAHYRPYGTGPQHRISSAHSIFWNTTGQGTRPSQVVQSQQARYGYVIGTQGTRTSVSTVGSRAQTNPIDHVEGVGRAGSLQPQSLFEDQRERAARRPRLHLSYYDDLLPVAISRPLGYFLHMQHRHLNHETLTLAAIDDIIARGGRRDWVDLRNATTDPLIVRKILRVCRAHADNPYAQRYHLWRHYVSRTAA